jgi:hypothetical protein
MCCSCNRREFLESSVLASLSAVALPLLTATAAAADPAVAAVPVGRAGPARVRGAFFFPPAQVVLDGKCEDSWAPERWFTWPGNQFEPEKEQAWFLGQVRQLSKGLDLELAMEESPLYTDAAIQAFVAEITANPPDALLLFLFWNSFSKKILPILDAFDGPVILYQPVGANHQLPPERFRTGKRLQYIHSVRHTAALERGLRSIHAWNRMAKGRVLRISGKATTTTEAVEPHFGTRLLTIPAAEFNQLYDSIPDAGPVAELAQDTRAQARHITDLSDQALLDAARAHLAVGQIRDRHQADAITIECLFLKHRKPCLSFALNNGRLQPCGCENDLNATLGLMLGSALFGRGGFQHNPDFDLEENLYFGSHCTCTTKLHGPDGESAVHDLRPFFHQLPKTAALDVQWPAGEPATLFKYQSATNQLDAWQGEIVSSPGTPPTGGCATRVMVRFPGVDDVCSVYAGPHPGLWCGAFGDHARTFAKLYGLELRGNRGSVGMPAKA